MELKPCPFCGGEAATEVSYCMIGDGMILRATVFCGGCGCSRTVKFSADRKPFEEYIEQFRAVEDMWNRRAE